MVNNNDEAGLRGLVEENEIQNEDTIRTTAGEVALNRQRDVAPPPGQESWGGRRPRPPPPVPPPTTASSGIIVPTTTSRNHADSGSSRVVRPTPTMMSNSVLRRDVPLLEERLVLRSSRGTSYNCYYHNESPPSRCTNHYQHRGNFFHPLRNLPPELFSCSMLLSHCEGERDHHQQEPDDGRRDHGHDDSLRGVADGRSTVVGVTSSPTARDSHDHNQNENIREVDHQEDKTLDNNSRRGTRCLHVLRVIEAALRIHHDFCSSSSDDEGDGDDDTERTHDTSYSK